MTFTDDTEDSGFPPIPVTQGFVDKVMFLCRKIPFSLTCIDCDLLIVDNEHLQKHYRETNNSHIVSASADASQVMLYMYHLRNYCVFSTFL